MEILATAIFRSNGIVGCSLMADKELKSSGRGSFGDRIDLHSSNSLIIKASLWLQHFPV